MIFKILNDLDLFTHTALQPYSIFAVDYDYHKHYEPDNYSKDILKLLTILRLVILIKIIHIKKRTLPLM